MTERQAHEEIERRIVALASGMLKEYDDVDGAIESIERGFQHAPKIGLVVNLAEVLKKAAHKKYKRRFGWRWLSRLEGQAAVLNAVIEKASNE